MNSLQVLLVEDDQEDIRSISDVFQKKGKVSIHYTDSVQEAMQLVSINRYDLIMIDLNLGIRNESGFHILQHIKQQPGTSYIPCVVFSSTRRLEEWNRCYSYGANGCYQKPIDPDSYDSVVELIADAFLFMIQKATYFN